MERRLKLAERICGISAAVSGVLLILGSIGDSTGRERLAGVMALVFLVSVIAGEGISHYRARQNRAAMEKLPRVSDCAEVIRKRTWTELRTGARTISTTAGRTHWYVTFETKNHGVCELEVPYDTYNTLRRGMKGMLCFKGSGFIGFKEH